MQNRSNRAEKKRNKSSAGDSSNSENTLEALLLLKYQSFQPHRDQAKPLNKRMNSCSFLQNSDRSNAKLERRSSRINGTICPKSNTSR